VASAGFLQNEKVLRYPHLLPFKNATSEIEENLCNTIAIDIIPVSMIFNKIVVCAIDRTISITHQVNHTQFN